MKRILFLPSNCIPFHAYSLQHRPLGGTESGVIRLAKALSKHGYDVTVASEFKNPPLSEPLYIPLHALSISHEFDAVVGVRDWQSVLPDVKTQKRFLWTGDAYDQPASVGIGDKRIANRIDGLLCVSNWQKETLCNASGFPKDKSFVINNGVDLDTFTKHKDIPKDPYRLIYSSTPYRGLKLLLEIFPKIKQKIPKASLVICSGYDVYKGTNPIPKSELQEYEQMIDKFLEMDGVIVRGNITQSELAEEMQKASILAYPNTFPETSCITAIEAKAAGAVVVTTSLGALPETVKNGGILINEDPSTMQYQEKFISECVSLLQDQEKLTNLSEIAIQESRNQTWYDVARNFARLI